jgi:FMN reductase
LPPEADPVDLRVVLGSSTPPGRLHRALEGAVDRAAASGTAADLLDLGTRRLGFADGTPPADLTDDTAAVVAAVEAARALVLATPVYRGSMTGALKNLLDLTPVPALQGKVVGLVAMGASDHHFLGAERHLRDVLAFFGALPMPVAVYLSGRDFADGVPGERAETALDELFAATVATASALDGVDAAAGPAPLAARAVKPRAAG